MPRVTDVRSSIHDGLLTAIFHRGYRSLFDFHNGDARVQDMCVSDPVFIASSLATAQTVFASIVHVEPVKDEYKKGFRLYLVDGWGMSERVRAMGAAGSAPRHIFELAFEGASSVLCKGMPAQGCNAVAKKRDKVGGKSAPITLMETCAPICWRNRVRARARPDAESRCTAETLVHRGPMRNPCVTREWVARKREVSSGGQERE
ncbi:hypothetical protein HETIRDRAFT_118870 [Heterobasidion irregulare TC 32-1]|uniref:Uncharacterized protein n=1 Tax=Heterobasidion irregulare (strain TC 32-1) TaxID=747525 RepID=W4JU80_HETIT|nr:uncharacterized protein HETIRDRAFT_118870 [Heterobasidion irregulare TC 32-1]ETW76645.1 hypothetical protein HETIRDRAFT_118870 [Heterobasidion irregulare TC 32-1]